MGKQPQDIGFSNSNSIMKRKSIIGDVPKLSGLDLRLDFGSTYRPQSMSELIDYNFIFLLNRHIYHEILPTNHRNHRRSRLYYHQ